MNKMLCTTVLISETFNVNIMLNMPIINIENRVGANSIIKFGLSHRVLYHNTDNSKYIHIQKVYDNYSKIITFLECSLL